MSESNFPLNIPDKEDHPDTTARLEGVDPKYFQTAAEKNKLKDAVIENHEKIKESNERISSIQQGLALFSASSEAEMTAEWNRRDGLGDTPIDGKEEIIRTDFTPSQYWKWDSSTTAKAVYAGRTVFIKDEYPKKDSENLVESGGTRSFFTKESSQNNQFHNPLFLYLNEDEKIILRQQTGETLFTAIESVFGGYGIKLKTLKNSRGQIIMPFNYLADEYYTLGFVYRLNSGNSLPVINTGVLENTNSGNTESGSVRTINLGSNYYLFLHERLKYNISENTAGGYLIDLDNRNEASISECEIFNPLVINAEEFIGKIPFSVGDFQKRIEGKLSELNSKLTIETEILKETKSSNVTTAMVLFNTEKDKTYIVKASSTDSLENGLEFYINDGSSTNSVKVFSSSSDFQNGVSFEFTAQSNGTFQWRVREIDLDVLFEVIEKKNISESLPEIEKNKKTINEILEFSKFYELKDFVTNSTTVFNTFDISQKKGNEIEYYFKAKYTGSFYIYGYREDNSFYPILEITNTDFNSGVIGKVIIPNDLINIGFRTFQEDVTIDFLILKGNQIKGKLDTSDFLLNQWKDSVIVKSGDSITAQSNGNFQYPFNISTGKYFEKFANNLGLSKAYIRGIGSSKYAWDTNGGSVAFVDQNTGEYHSRSNDYNFDNYIGNITVPDGTVAIRSAFSSWLRITSMFPASIKDTINAVIIAGATNDADDDTPISWIANDATDPEWASSSEYNGGDYNLTTLKGGIASTIMKFQKWMPDAIITIETPLSGRGNSTNNSRPDRFETVEFQKSEKVREAAKRFSCPVIDVNAECGINAVNGGNYMADGVHPNNEGEDMIVRVETAKMRAIYPKI